MDVFIGIMLILLLTAQGMTYYSVAYLFAWLRSRVIPPSALVPDEDVEEGEEEMPEENSRGLYL